jgi:hypothetical protein
MNTNAIDNITIATTTTTCSITTAIHGIAIGTLEATMPVILEHGTMQLGEFVGCIMTREQVIRELLNAQSEAIATLAAMHVPMTEHSRIIDLLCQQRHALHEQALTMLMA